MLPLRKKQKYNFKLHLIESLYYFGKLLEQVLW